MSPSPRRAAVASLDPVLGPVAADNRNSHPNTTVMALAAKAHREGIPPDLLLRWIRLTLRGPVSDVTRRDDLYTHLVSAAFAHDAKASSLSGRAARRRTAAVRIVGHLLSPLPEHCSLTPRSEATARAALAVLGSEFLSRAESDGFDTIVTSRADVALSLGCSLGTAQRALANCVSAGWLRRMPQRLGAPPRWKLTRGPGAIARQHPDLVHALATGDDTHPLAEILRIVDHPAIGYGTLPLGHRAWWEAFLLEAEADGSLAGPETAVRRRHRETWLDAVTGSLDDPDHDPSQPLRVTLDRLATSTSAAAERGAAAVARAEKAAARAAEVATVRAERERIRVGLDRLWAAYPIPHVGAAQRKRDAWVRSVMAALATSPPADHLRPYLARQVAHALTAHGHYRAPVAERVARLIAGLTQPQQESAA